MMDLLPGLILWMTVFWRAISAQNTAAAATDAALPQDEVRPSSLQSGIVQLSTVHSDEEKISTVQVTRIRTSTVRYDSQETTTDHNERKPGGKDSSTVETDRGSEVATIQNNVINLSTSQNDTGALSTVQSNTIDISTIHSDKNMELSSRKEDNDLSTLAESPEQLSTVWNGIEELSTVKQNHGELSTVQHADAIDDSTIKHAGMETSTISMETSTISVETSTISRETSTISRDTHREISTVQEYAFTNTSQNNTSTATFVSPRAPPQTTSATDNHTTAGSTHSALITAQAAEAQSDVEGRVTKGNATDGNTTAQTDSTSSASLSEANFINTTWPVPSGAVVLEMTTDTMTSYVKRRKLAPVAVIGMTVAPTVFVLLSITILLICRSRRSVKRMRRCSVDEDAIHDLHVDLKKTDMQRLHDIKPSNRNSHPDGGGYYNTALDEGALKVPKNYFQDGLDELAIEEALDDLAGCQVNGSGVSATVPERPKKAGRSVDPKNRFSLGPVSMQDENPSTQSTYDNIYTHNTFREIQEHE